MPRMAQGLLDAAKNARGRLTVGSAMAAAKKSTGLWSNADVVGIALAKLTRKKDPFPEISTLSFDRESAPSRQFQ